MKCKWCGTECGDNYFCPTGGNTRAAANTGETGSVTKSYCFDGFIAMFKGTLALGSEYIESETFYMLNKRDIWNWYKSIPFIREY